MKRRPIKALIYSGAGRLEVASSAALIVLAAFLKGDPAKQPLPVWLAGPAAWLFTHGLYAVLALTVISGLAKLVRQKMTRPSLQEGVAGRAWSQGQSIVTVQSLPDLSRVSTLAPEAQSALIREYAEKTFVSPEWVKKRLERGKMAARSYTGYPVEVKGALWGSLVIDSLSPQGKPNPEHRRTCKLFTKLLGKRLEGG